jgi:hypothetical protein
MHATAPVRVLDGTDLLEERDCRLLRLRDGRPAAVWRGMAYPLREGGTIDITEPGEPPAECLPWPIVAKREFGSQRWALVEGVEEAWVLVEGSVTERDGIALKLRSAGVEVLRVGPWFGDSPEGCAADWFIRVAWRPDRGNLGELVGAVLGAPANGEGIGSGAVEELRRNLIRAEFERLRRQGSALQERVAQLLEELGASAALRDRVAALEAELEKLGRAAEEIGTASPAIEHGDSPAAADKAPVRPAQRLQNEVAAALQALLPEMELLRDSLTVACAEYRDRSALYRALRELGQRGQGLPSGWKKLHGVEGWWERHVSNGQDDTGRIYATAPRGKRGWSVLVSHKSEQARDIAWLKRACL